MWCIWVVYHKQTKKEKSHRTAFGSYPCSLLLLNRGKAQTWSVYNTNTKHSFTHLVQRTYTIITAFLRTSKLQLNRKVFFQPKYNRCFSALQCDQKLSDYFTHQSLFTGLEEAELPMLKELYTVFCGFRGSGRTFDRLSQVVWHQKEQRSTSLKRKKKNKYKHSGTVFIHNIFISWNSRWLLATFLGQIGCYVFPVIKHIP